jgi:hypothetical protein
MGWLTIEDFRIVLKLKMSTSKRQMMVMRKSALHDYEAKIYWARGLARRLGRSKVRWQCQ